MAITKKELMKFEAAMTEAALRRTSPISPDIPIPNGLGHTKGFLYAAEMTNDARVDVACSSSVHHAFGRNDKTTTQGGRHLYSSRLLALRALRFAVENDCARRLRRIDVMIESELSEGQHE